MNKTLTTFEAGGNIHAGEFMHHGKLYCAARIPTERGWEWSLEVKNAPRSVDGGWEIVPAVFRHHAKRALLEILVEPRF